MSTLLLTGVVVDASNERELEALRVDIHCGSSHVATAITSARGEFVQKIEIPQGLPSGRPTSQLTFHVFRGDEALDVAEQSWRSSGRGRLSARLALDLQPDREESTVNRLSIGSYAELLKHEQEILRRIRAVPNGGNLFLIHPFLLFEDIGVEL
ncbi:MAG: hypothetical protein HYY65_13860 [Candidatus Tectomicrobia bacterium]|uniref:Uncharacterized protein n=1 Tax=Tectimicrobiota bacterium TaxID=2528274 RepID=A0A932GS21_UNCTE|nr:hypothetical protein [Candidatus Tectomicrobia bacterium]